MLGVLVPASEVVLAATRSARLERLDVRPGDHVDEGDTIAQMEVSNDEAALAMATASWRASKAELDRVELELQDARVSRRSAERLGTVVSEDELRELRLLEKLAEARKRSAEASVSRQRSMVDEASVRVAEAELRVPFAGVIADRYTDPGATLDVGEPVVRLISDIWLVRFAVPDEEVKRLRVGAMVVVHFKGEDGSSAPHEVEGTVRTVAPEIDAKTRLVLAEAELWRHDGGERALRVGEVGRVQILEGEPRAVGREGEHVDLGTRTSSARPSQLGAARGARGRVVSTRG